MCLLIFYYSAIVSFMENLSMTTFFPGLKCLFFSLCFRQFVFCIPKLCVFSSLSIRRFWGERGKMEAKKGESFLFSPSPLPHPQSPLPVPSFVRWGYLLLNPIKIYKQTNNRGHPTTGSLPNAVKTLF